MMLKFNDNSKYLHQNHKTAIKFSKTKKTLYDGRKMCADVVVVVVVGFSLYFGLAFSI